MAAARLDPSEAGKCVVVPTWVPHLHVQPAQLALDRFGGENPSPPLPTRLRVLLNAVPQVLSPRRALRSAILP